MTRALRVRRSGPGVTVQDLGRPGHLVHGLSCGGATDRLALAEGAALLGQRADFAAIEITGMGGIFEAEGDSIRIALTGAPMQATVEGEPVAWGASHLLHRGQRLAVGAARKGSYGYLHVGGGIATPPFLDSRSAHMTAGIGGPLEDGALLPVGPDTGGTGTGMTLDVADRFGGGIVRIVPSVQTDRFAPEDLERFEQTQFVRDARSNRMGVRLNSDAPPLTPRDQLNILSEVIVPGDIQITGDGTPFVLLADCQTTGGYPRIGTVIPPDLPIVAQTSAGKRIQFQFITRDQALALYRAAAAHLKTLPKAIRPLIRDPHDIRDLLSYQLISGITKGDD
jgi:allophanate hydrolase